MDRIVLGVVAILLAVFSYSLWDKNNDLKDEVKRATEVAEISINSTMLSKATEFTFMKVKNQFTYHMDEEDIGPRKGDWEAIYSWEYPFNFGYKIKSDWNWCIHIDQDKSIVSINAPKIEQLNKSDASPRVGKIFNGGVRATQVAAQEWMVDLANEKMKKTADAYLNNETVQDSVKRSLASFFRGILNDAREGERPINEVIINITSENSCRT